MNKKHNKELNLEEIKQLIKNSTVRFNPYSDDVQWKMARPEKYDIKNHLKNKLHMLYKVTKAKKGRIKLWFYLSRKYDLVIVVECERKALNVITYYNKTKKGMRMI